MVVVVLLHGWNLQHHLHHVDLHVKAVEGFPLAMSHVFPTQGLQLHHVGLAVFDAAMCLQAAEAKFAKANGAASAGGVHSASGLLADLALLQGTDNDGHLADDGAGTEQWKPPEDQKGDGRTKLNDLLGY